VPEFSPEVYVQGAVVDPPEDDDADYEPMEEEPEQTEEEALARAMAISEAEERARWIGLEAAIQASQQAPLETSLLRIPWLVCGRHRRGGALGWP
jgi:non-canonical (house-cleaning) NTP pyrophosphatase